MVRNGRFAMNKPVKSLSLFASGAAGDDPQPNGDGSLGHADAAASTTMPLPPQPAAKSQAASTKAASRALNAVVRASTQVALATHVEPTPHPKVERSHGHALQHGVMLTETERIRLQVMQVQLKLTGLALYEGPIDGTLNPATVAGVRHFQTLKGMRDSGVLTAGTLNALGVHPLA
jgi:murein L,D-transpeptidase YcbB/YkuD